MIPEYVNQRNVQKSKYIRMIRARAEAVKNTNSAADVSRAVPANKTLK